MNDKRNGAEQGKSVLIVVTVLALIAVLGFLAARHMGDSRTQSLSPATVKVVSDLGATVEARLYHGGLESATNAVDSFAGRVMSLLALYEGASEGKFHVAHFHVTNTESAAVALQDGMRPLNLEKGDPFYMGIALQSGELKETLPALSEDFEPALEADITRALERLVSAIRAQKAAPDPDPVTDTIVEKVKTIVPNYQTLSPDEGAKLLQQNMMAEFQKSAADLEARRESMRAAVEAAEASGNKEELEKLRAAITQAELEHANKLKAIVSESTALQKALSQLKSKP